MPLFSDITRRRYSTVAIVVFNTAVMLVLINVVLGVVYFLKDRPSSPGTMSDPGPMSAEGYFYKSGAPVDNGKRRAADLAVFDYGAYEGVLPEQQVSQLLDESFEFSQAGVDYQPWVQFGPQVYSGKLLNVEEDAMGFPRRRTVNAAPVGDRVIRVFTFGGSTTFGVGVPDQHTWPSCLSDILNERAKAEGLDATVEVSNYGRRSYFPSLELILLLDLFRSGQRPDLVIYFDGLNWGEAEDVPNWTRIFRKRMQDAQSAQLPDSLAKVPLVRLVKSFGSSAEPPASATAGSELPTVDHVVERFIQSHETVRLVCGQYQSRALFVLQPDAMFNYPKSLYREPALCVRPRDRERREEFYGVMTGQDQYVNLTGLFEKWGRKAIVDMGHYSPNFNRFVAEEIARNIDLDQLLPEPATGRTTPTGAPRS